MLNLHVFYEAEGLFCERSEYYGVWVGLSPGTSEKWVLAIRPLTKQATADAVLSFLNESCGSLLDMSCRCMRGKTSC